MQSRGGKPEYLEFILSCLASFLLAKTICSHCCRIDCSILLVNPQDTLNLFHLKWRDGSQFSKSSRFAQDSTWKSFWSGPLRLSLIAFWWAASSKLAMFGSGIWTDLCGIILSRESCMNWLAFGLCRVGSVCLLSNDITVYLPGSHLSRSSFCLMGWWGQLWNVHVFNVEAIQLY
jgi:hypothetical protein